ncbi:MAG: hypothetical protein SFY32_13565 [Bacteroidota bacterium]|nr:hypothetical protein [Bacteroidota bacterium]
MKPKLLLRIATGCLIFFAFGHSIGHLTRHNISDPKAKEVLQQMIDNKFDMFGQLRSFDENYTGMSLNLIFTLLAFASILWLLSTQTEKYPQMVKKILVPITICVLGFSVTSYLYFFTLPAITCLLASILTSWAIFKLTDNNPIR